MIRYLLKSPFFQMIHHEIALSFRSLSEILHPIWFYIITVTLFPLAISAEPIVLRQFAPGIIWIALLLAILLSLDRMFMQDHEEGTLEQLLLSAYPLAWLIFAKLIVHWVITGLPLLIFTPLLTTFLHLPANETKILIYSLLLGSPSLIIIGSIGAAITVGLRNRGILLTILILPLLIPILIFGVGSITHGEGTYAVGELSVLLAILILALSLGPYAIATALRISTQ